VLVHGERVARAPDALLVRQEVLLGLIVGEVQFDRLDEGGLLLVAVGHLFRDSRDVEIELRVLAERNRHHELHRKLTRLVRGIRIADGCNGDAVGDPGPADAVDELGAVQIGLSRGDVDNVLVYRGA
jgi:hypothetical protein